jgi:DNA-binding response OmpR family regulator
LLVEDEQMVRQMVKGMLEAQGYVVLEAQEGADAVRIAAEYPGPIDLLLSDVLMPRMNGRELADRLLAQRKELRVLFVSGYPDEVITGHRVPGPGGAFLQKPFTYESLANKVREVLERPGHAERCHTHPAESLGR